MSYQAIGLPKEQTQSRFKQLFAACIGNILEYYDFIVYAFLAGVIGKNFFPSDDPTITLLSSFAAFGVAYLARPIGGIVIGRIADTLGRKVALMITIFGMAIGTVGIGLLPTYSQVGIVAPILLVITRLLQGFSAGGEWGSATTFIVETAPENRRGLFGSIGQASIASSNLLSSFVVAVVIYLTTTEALNAWAWRIPFLLGGLLLPVGLYMRRNLEETVSFKESKKEPVQNKGMGEAILSTSKAFGFTIIWTVSYYIMLSYMPTFLQKHAGFTNSQALWMSTTSLVALVVTIPFFGWLSDRIGRKPLLLACCLAFIILPFPVFYLIISGVSGIVVIISMVIFNLFIAAFSGAGPAALVELFPTHSRTMLLSFGYGLAVAIFGGFSPFIATWLIDRTGTPLSITAYLIVAAIASLLTISTFRETAHEPLR